MALIILAAWFVLLTAYGAWHWRRPKRNRLDGWWHDPWYGETKGQRGFGPLAWERACRESDQRSRARRGEES